LGGGFTREPDDLSGCGHAVTEPRVSVIIATWNAGQVLGRCLESIARQVVSDGFETIVVDNASTDCTAEVLARHRDRVSVITNDHNAAYSGGNNTGATAARGRVLFFLNSDTELLGPDVLERLADAVEASGVGIAGPMLVNPDGSLQPSCAAHPGVARALLVASGLHRLLPDAALVRVEPERWSHGRAVDVGWVKGAAVAVRADVFRELGGFWTTLYGEEQDLAYRAQARGARVRFEPAAKVMHIGNFSLGQWLSDPARAARVAYAELMFLRTHYAPTRAAAIRSIVGTGYLVRAVAHAALGRRARARVYAALARSYATAPPT
jgi:GT2 family glycosyltransferase